MRALPLGLLFLAACSPTPPNPGNHSTGGGSGQGSLYFTVTNATGRYWGTAIAIITASTTDFTDSTSVDVTAGRTNGDLAALNPPGANSAFALQVDLRFHPVTGHSQDGSGSTPCTSGTTTTNTNFPWLLRFDVPSWNPGTMLGLTAMTMPTNLSSCNLASFTGTFAPPPSATLALDAFRGTTPFDVHFQGQGESTREPDHVTEKWNWDVTITIQPQAGP